MSVLLHALVSPVWERMCFLLSAGWSSPGLSDGECIVGAHVSVCGVCVRV